LSAHFAGFVWNLFTEGNARIVAAILSHDPFGRLVRSPGTPPRSNGLHATDMADYSVYLVECRDGSLYTGIATDVSRRLAEHEQGAKGAKYLRGKGPFRLIYQQEIGDRSLASKVESRIKRLPRVEKANVARLPDRIESLMRDLNASSKER
jgi:putative endonuclease